MDLTAFTTQKIILGEMMTQGGSADVLEAINTIPLDAFTDARHRAIFGLISHNVREGYPVDPYALESEARKHDVSFAFLTELFSYINVNLEPHVKRLKAAYNLRKIQAMAGNVTEMIESGSDLKTVFDEVATSLSAVELSGSEYKTRALPEIVENYDSILADRMDNRGISFGFPGMDKAGGRMRPGNVSIIAAPPGMGKTEIAISITKSAAYNQKKSVLFFSLEMMDVELADRIIAEDANISGELLDNPLMIDQNWERTDQIGPDMAKIGTALERIRDKGSQIYVHEEPNVSHQRIGSVIEKMQKRDGALGLVIIDYIQLVTAPGAKSRFDEVAKVSREIKALAKRHKVPILCLAQLNREAVKAWATREPMNSDLRECGQLEQDADKICFLYGPESRDTTSPNCGLVMPIFTKRRGGPAGRAVLEFIGGHYRDTDRSLVVEDEESSGGDWR